MSTGRRQFKKSMSTFSRAKRDVDEIYSGLLGTILNGSRQVEVDGRNNFVWVRLRDNQSELIQASNRTVAPIYNYPVLVRRQKVNPSIFEVIDVDSERYLGQLGNTNSVPKHAAQHQFNPDAPGGDIVWAYDRQLMPLLVHPSGTAGAGNVVIEPDVYYQDGAWKYGGNTGTADLLALKPTDNTAKMVLVYLDSNTNPQLSAGSTFDASLTGTVEVMPHVPTLGTSSDVPLAWVRLVSGTSSILWDNLYDARPWIVGDGVATTGTSRHIIQDEGSNLADRPYLNFQGTSIWAIDNPGNNATDIIVSGTAGGGGSGHTIQNEGTPLTARTNLNFVGSEVTAVDDAGNDATIVYVTGSASAGVTFASKNEVLAGVVPDKAIAPLTMPWIVVGDGFVRNDVYVTGSARGEGAFEAQQSRLNTSQVAEGDWSTIGGGMGNRANQPYGVIGGGYINNVQQGTGSAITSGDDNDIATSNWGFIGGGRLNDMDGSHGAGVVAGKSNIINNSAYGFVLGGFSNSVTSSKYAGAAGFDNSVTSSESSFAFGSSNSVLTSARSFAVGRNQSISTSPNSVAGGYRNSIQYSDDSLAVGRDNSLYYSYWSSVHGLSNYAARSYSSLIAGNNNQLYNSHYVTAFGYYNYSQSGTASILSGRYSRALLYGSVVRAIPKISSTINQTIKLIFARRTTNNTATEMFLNSGNTHRALIPADSAWAFRILVSAKRNDATGGAAAYEFTGLLNRDTTIASTAIVGSVTKTVIAETDAGWDVGVTADNTNGALVITVTGENAKTIDWIAEAEIVQAQ